MITLEGDTLVFRFPQVHKHARTEIEFQRTLRIPDNLEEYPLPPGLGRFPIRHTEDFKPRLPREWLERGGVMLPLHRAEAMWISFRRRWFGEGYPCAVKIAAGKINAVSGKRWQPELDPGERDYIVVPDQPWLDGYCVAKDQVRQFIAMPMGAGYTAEEQITGKAEHGGLQVIVYPMKAERYEQLLRDRDHASEAFDDRARCGSLGGMLRTRCLAVASAPPTAMGLAAGGRMRQQIYADPYGLDAWEGAVSSRCFVTLLDAAQWQEVTGGKPPTRPPTAAEYTSAGLPWFDYYADAETLAGAPALSALRSVAEMAGDKGDPYGANGPVAPDKVVQLGSRPGESPPG
jgi:hypothetical protein